MEENLGGAAGAPDGLDRFQPPRLVPRRQDDLEPLGRQLPARLETDPLVSPGDQRDSERTRRGSADGLTESAGGENSLGAWWQKLEWGRRAGSAGVPLDRRIRDGRVHVSSSPIGAARA